MKVCRKCGCELIVGENWYKSLAENHSYICKGCFGIQRRERYRKKHPVKTRPTTCRECGCNLIVGENWHESQARGHSYICIECYKTYKREYYRRHRGEIIAYNKDHREKQAAYQREYRREHHKEIIAYQREYRQTRREEKATYNRQYSLEHREELSAYQREYYQKNREKIRVYEQERYQTNIQFKLTRVLRARLRSALKGDCKPGSAVRDLGCSIPELMSHLKSQFQEGMTWDNYGEWHIDHIIPLSSFDLTDREQLLRACHYTNLQPLWAAENLSKGAKIPAFSSVVDIV